MPSFAIEAPSAANPLSDDTLLRTLFAAASSDRVQIQSGAQQLQQWERQPGFFSALQSVYMNLSLPLEVRHLASIQLKNAVDKYWRDGAPASIPAAEKAMIRSRSLDTVVQEPDAKLARQSSIFLGKIVRAEYPRKWPEAVPLILARLQTCWTSHDLQGTLRALLVVLCIIKELSITRMPTSRKTLQEAAPNIAQIVFPIYHACAQQWLSSVNSDTAGHERGLLQSMECSLLALRITRRLFVVGYEHLNRDEQAVDWWKSLQSQFALMLDLLDKKNAHQIPPVARVSLEDHALQISKLHCKLAADKAAAFALMPDAINLVHSYWQHAHDYNKMHSLTSLQDLTGTDSNPEDSIEDNDDVPCGEKIALRGLLLLRACARMVFLPLQTFRMPRAEDKAERNMAQEYIKTRLLTSEFCIQIMTTLVTRFFVFTARDLQQWEDAPDEWERDQDSAADDWEYSVRTCSEKLFLDLIIHRSEELVPALIRLIESTDLQQSDNVLLKDSIYAAIGLSAPVLQGLLDFSSLLETSFAKDVAIQAPGYNIIRRRVAIVLGQWTPVKEGLNRPLIYQIFQHLLNPADSTNDLVVRLTAAKQLQNIVEPFDFSPDSFVPFAAHILPSVLTLTQDVDSTELRLSLLTTLSSVTAKMENLISPFGDSILQVLGSLWNEAGSELLLKQHILAALRTLVAAMERDSQRYHGIMVPLIQSSISTGPEDASYLEEEALDLWASVLEQSHESSASDLQGLVQYIPNLLDSASESLRVVLEITETYVYLAPSLLLQNGPHLCRPLHPLLIGNKDHKLDHTIVGQTRSLFDALLRCSIRNGVSGEFRDLIGSLVANDILPALLNALHDTSKAHSTSGPNKRVPQIDGVVESEYFSLLARIAVVDAQFFLEVVDAAQPGQGRANTLKWLLSEWLGEMDNVTAPAARKLSTLALTNLLTTGEPLVFSQMQSLMSLWTDVLHDLLEVSSDVPPAYDIQSSSSLLSSPQASLESTESRQVDSLVYTRDRLLSETDTPATMRSKEFVLLDPVHTIDLRDYIRQKLGAAITLSGGMESFNSQWIDGVVDKDILAGFGALNII